MKLEVHDRTCLCPTCGRLHIVKEVKDQKILNHPGFPMLVCGECTKGYFPDFMRTITHKFKKMEIKA